MRIADELHSALHAAGIEGPYIVVGNAFGGDPVRTFADLYMPEIAGMVLVEADASDVEPKAMQDNDHDGNARYKVAMYDAFISEMEQMSWDEAWLQQHRRSFGSRPLRVLTTGNHGVGHLPATNALDPKHLEYEHQIALSQAHWLELSSNAKQIFPPQSSEYIEFDQPDAVVGAIREVYDQSGKPR